MFSGCIIDILSLCDVSNQMLNRSKISFELNVPVILHDNGLSHDFTQQWLYTKGNLGTEW